jgi:hypothetical protein
MLVGTPFGKAGEKAEDSFGICMEYVRSIAMNKDSIGVVFIICIASYMLPSFYEEDAFARLSEFLRADATGKAGPNYEYVANHPARFVVTAVTSERSLQSSDPSKNLVRRHELE